MMIELWQGLTHNTRLLFRLVGASRCDKQPVHSCEEMPIVPHNIHSPRWLASVLSLGLITSSAQSLEVQTPSSPDSVKNDGAQEVSLTTTDTDNQDNLNSLPDGLSLIQLNNGMDVLVVEDHSIPNANMYLFWKVGSRNESPGITGLSHFFEHMMFNGSKNYGPKQFDRVMEAAGGANNAYTTQNITAYTNWFPSESLETIFKLEADRIGHLSIDPKMVESERGVVSSERSTRLENSNYRRLSVALNGIAFRAHPYSWPVIGHQSDIDHWTLSDLTDYYRQYYAPNNAFVVIAGDVTASKVKTLAKQYFEPIPAQPAPREIHTVEPIQTGERRSYVYKASATSPNILMGFHVPATRHEDHTALSLLASILSDGDSARLTRNLVEEQQIATDVAAFMPQSFDANLFQVYATATPNTSAETLEKALINEINHIINNGVTSKELEKVQNLAEVDFYRTLSTINGKANTLGSYQLFHGDFRKMYDAVDRYRQVTTTDIQRVAKTYLRRANRSVAILDNKVDSREGDL